MDKLIEELVKYNEQVLYGQQPKIVEAERSRIYAEHLQT